MLLRAAILAFVMATSTACNSLSSPPKQVESEQVPEQTQGVAEVPAFLLDSSKYDSIGLAEDDRYSCVGAIVTQSGDVIGSAVLIHKNAILSAQHCFALSEDPPKYFWTHGGQFLRLGKIHKASPYAPGFPMNDIVLCILDGDCYEPPAELSKRTWDLIPGEELVSVGWSLGYKKVSERGVMRYYGSLIEDGGQVMRMLALNGSVYYGDSGGGIFEDSGKLAGIISFFGVDPNSGSVIDNGAMKVCHYYEWIDNIMKSKFCDWPWYEE